MGGSAKAANREAAIARMDEMARQQDIRVGTGKVNDIFAKNFGEDFFTGRREAYQNYATPQLQDQYDKAGKELTFSLARNGLLDSSARGQKEGELQKMFDTNRQAITDQAISQESQSRNAVEDARSGLVTMLNATGDAQGAANSALARSAALSQPQAFSPLTNLFADFTGALATQAQQERAAAMSGGLVKPAFNTGLFSSGKPVVSK